MKLFGQMVEPRGRGSARRKASTYTAQHRKTRTHIYASSGIRTRDPSVRVALESCYC
jgi:hypothetical protein